MVIFYAIVNFGCTLIPFLLVEIYLSDRVWGKAGKYCLAVTGASISAAFFAYFFSVPIVILRGDWNSESVYKYMVPSAAVFAFCAVLIRIYKAVFNSKL